MDCDKSPGGYGLLIHCGRNMEQSTAVGIAIDEKPLFAGPACSSKDHLFIPHPTYCVTFGEYEQGDVIDHPPCLDPFQLDFQDHHWADITLDENFIWHQSASC